MEIPLYGKNLKNERLLSIFRFASDISYTEKSKLKSKHWRKYYDDKNWNLKNLESFRDKNGLSLGLDDNYDFPISNYLSFLQEIGEETLFDLLDRESVGRANSAKYKNVFLDLNKMYAAYWFQLLTRHETSKHTNKVYCEIGGRFWAIS